MDNFVSSVLSGFSQVVGKLLGHPLDFLAGKSCNTKCQPMWDFFCYIENFCISHLLKLALVIVLLYFVLLFLYLSYKLGICQCMCHTFCRGIWACFRACFSVLECCCSCLCLNLQKHNQKRRMKRARDIEELEISSDEEDCEGSTFSQAQRDTEAKRRKRLRSRRGREYKEEHLRRALRPKHLRIRVRLSRGDSLNLKKKTSIENGDYHICPVDHIRVTRTSKFAHKRGSFKASSSHWRK